MKRSPLKRKTGLKAKTRLKPQSRKRGEQVAEYNRQADDHPPIVTCALCGVPGPKETMDRHHLRGREGGQLLKEWVWLHRPCHEWVENNRKAAAEKGLLLPRHDRH